MNLKQRFRMTNVHSISKFIQIEKHFSRLEVNVIFQCPFQYFFGRRDSGSLIESDMRAVGETCSTLHNPNRLPKNNPTSSVSGNLAAALRAKKYPYIHSPTKEVGQYRCRRK